MVKRLSKNRRGTSTAGCLGSLILLGIVLYYGINLGEVWWRYFEIKDRMKSAARFSTTQTVQQMMRQLQNDAEEVGLPPEARAFKIHKVEHPPSVSIETEYEEQLDLPLLHRKVRFNPSISLTQW